MSSGKRPRSSMAMKRTTSMSVFTPGLIGSDPTPDPNPRQRQRTAVDSVVPSVALLPEIMSHPGETKTAVQVAEFLLACGICKRNLGPGKDTFIYRGDAAFCSLECREKQMKRDASNEKLSRIARKSEALPPNAGREKASGSSEPVAAS